MFLSISKSVGNRITDGFTDGTDASIIIFLLPTEVPSVIIEKYLKKIHFIKL